MDIRGFISGMEVVAPPGLAEEFDTGRIGLIIEGKKDINRVCCALDASFRVVEEAVRQQADMLVVHHTPIFHPVTAVRGPLVSLLRPVLASGMNIFVMHTNFDHAPLGVNDSLAGLLGLTNTTPMALGLVGDCQLVPDQIGKILHSPLRVWGELHSIRRLAVVGGSGFDVGLIQEALSLGADAFLSAEAKHSVIRESPLPLVEATHYALEAPAMQMLSSRMGWHYIDDPPDMVPIQ
ncbi:MAG: Nif3-like dinuclear metal center hexameric protein [Methanomicrobiales archaeon]